MANRPRVIPHGNASTARILPLTADGGHFVRVGWFTTIPRNTISVTTVGGREPIALLVVSPDTPAEAAWAAMSIAATNPGTAQAVGILTAEEAPERPQAVARSPATLTRDSTVDP